MGNENESIIIMYEEYDLVQENYCTCPKCGGPMGLYTNKREVGEICALYSAHCRKCDIVTTPTNYPTVYRELEVLKSELLEEAEEQ